jgi:hypothetical protein
MRLAILALLIACVTAANTDLKQDKDWVAWKSKHRKTYLSKDESKKYYYYL